MGTVNYQTKVYPAKTKLLMCLKLQIITFLISAFEQKNNTIHIYNVKTGKLLLLAVLFLLLLL